MKGVILETNDSTIQFIENSLLKKNTAVAPFTSQRIPISSVERIKIRKKGAVGRGILFGALSGAMLGAIIGFADGDDVCEPGSWCILQFSAEEKAAVGATTAIIPGLAVGALIGRNRKTIYINGDQTLYVNSRGELMEYALIK